jgi:hypothetical protein
MNKNFIKAIVLALILGGTVYYLMSCSNAVEPIKTAKADQKTAQKAAVDKESIHKKVKETFVCPKLDMTIEDAEAQGALCPEGRAMLDKVDRMIEGKVTEDDIMDLVANYRNQGRSLVTKLGTPACDENGKLKMDVYIMSYCPFGVRFVDGILNPMVSDLGDSLDWTPYYILYDKGNGQLDSMHGEQEVQEDLRQICIREKWGTKTWLAYMNCFSTEIFAKQKGGGAASWDFCAKKAGINSADLQKCYDNDAKTLAKKDIDMARNYGANGSPTAVYNCSKSIVGAIPYDRIKPAICKMYTGTKPQACN